MYLNCGGLSANFVEIQLLIERTKPKLVMVSETHVTEALGDELFQITGYRHLSCYSDSRHTGGVMMYLKQNINWKNVIQRQEQRNWFLAVDICQGMRPGRYGVLYHSPSESQSVFLDILENSWLEYFYDPSKFNLITGDFNIDWLESRNASSLKQVTELFGMKQQVKDCTRVSRTSQTMIDLFFSNCELNVCTVPSFKISDHETLCLSDQNTLDDTKHSLKKVKCWKRYSKDALLSLLRQNMTRAFSLGDVNENASNLIGTLTNCVRQLVSWKTVEENTSKKWYNTNGELGELKDKRDRAYCKYLHTTIESQIERAWAAYKLKRNIYSHALRRRKREFIQESIENNRRDSKQLWKILKRLIKPDVPPAQYVSFEGIEERDEAAVAEKFNQYFLESIHEINTSIEDAVEPIGLQNEYTTTRFSRFAPITLEKLRSAVWSLESKAGSDDISATVLKDAFAVISEPLLNVINDSLASGVVPLSWKESVVVPIGKVNGTVKAEEHRPINMLPLYEKVLELVVKEQLLEYVMSNDLLAPEQSGYRKEHSCETALNLVLAKWKEFLERKMSIVAVFLDLKRAFETISREKLIQTLVKYGISDTVLKWFSSYLECRSQRTKYKTVISEAKETLFGVPQGSVLGPLLFILYINAKSVLCNCDINLFADDTVIFIASDNAFAATELMNSDLANLSNWLMFKKLKLNVSKTKFMIVSNKSVDKSNLCMQMDGVPLECVSEIKYLGVIIDEKLNFKKHIDYTINKIARKYGVLCRLSSDLSQWSLIYLYKAIISPHFDFCPSIIYLANEQQMSRLQKLQNKVMRIILKVNRRTPVIAMLDTLQWLSVRQRVSFLTLLLIHKITKGQAPDYLQNRIQRGRDIHQYDTRRANDIRSASFLLASTQNSLFYKGVKLYNRLPDEAKAENNVHAFKRKCVAFVKINVPV